MLLSLQAEFIEYLLQDNNTNTKTEMSAKSILIFSDTDGLHEEKLARAFAAHGFDSRRVAVGDCRIEYSSKYPGLYIPGFENKLPDAAFVRAIPAGSFEQVTFRLDILHALEACGVLVYNNARSIERTVDKGMTSFLMAQAGIASPATWVSESREEAEVIVRREVQEGEKVVLKPLFGNCGRGLLLIDEPGQLPALEEVEGVYYLQRFAGNEHGQGRDWRVFVIANHAVAAMERLSEHWITNRARGGKCLPAILTPEIRELAEAASRSIDMAYAGVDIIRDEKGNYMVLEVNSVPAWRGLQSVVDKDISQLIADDVVGRIKQQNTQASVAE